MTKEDDEFGPVDLSKEEPDKLPKQPLLYGWICPRCGTVHSQFVMQCGCLPPTRTWTGTSIGEELNSEV